ncbi:protein disulfide-isomerase [Aplochiton taeniatus]
MKSLLRIGAIYCCLWVCSIADPQTNRQGEKAIPEKDGVLQLKKGNFNRALRRHKQLLVHFYAPLSGDGQRVLAAFRGVAPEQRESEVTLGVVDISKEKELAKELNATGPPAVRLFLFGDKHNPIPCPDPRSTATILTWLKRRAGPSAEVITDLSQLDDSEQLLVLGVFQDLDQGAVQVFYAAAVNLPDIHFAVTQNQTISRKYGVTQEAVLLLRQSTLIQVHEMSSQTSEKELITFISVYQMDLVTEYNGKTAGEILSSLVLNHAILFVNKSAEDFQQLHAAFYNAAETFRGQILFVFVNVDEPRNGRMMEYFHVREPEAPLVRLVNLTDHVTYHLPSDTLDTDTVTGFCHTYLEGKAKPKMQSEVPTESWDKQPVKELVGQNLEKVVFNPETTSFVLFYLPYSQKSRSLFSLWEELAQAFLDREDVVIARIDASANDINLPLLKPYPVLRLFPALYAERMLTYSGKRNVKNLVEFVEQEMKKAKKEKVKHAAVALPL